MTVHFIGAGPGAADLITIRGLNMIRNCHVCLYAGSLVPKEILQYAPAGARIVDTASLNLDQIIDEIQSAHRHNQDVARIHSGDPSIYGAISEQIRRLEKLGIPFDITPGVPAFAAAAAELKLELTLPDVTQSIVLTRTSMKSSAMPPGETLDNFARTGATMAIHLSVRNLRKVQEKLIPYFGEDCPVIIAYRVTWPDQQFIFGTLGDIRTRVRAAKITRTALILVGPALNATNFSDSALYDKSHQHLMRNRKTEVKNTVTEPGTSEPA